MINEQLGNSERRRRLAISLDSKEFYSLVTFHLRHNPKNAFEMLKHATSNKIDNCRKQAIICSEDSSNPVQQEDAITLLKILDDMTVEMKNSVNQNNIDKN